MLISIWILLTQGIGATGYQTQYPGQFQAYPPQPVDSAPAPDKLFVSNNANQGNIIYSQPPNMHVSSTNQFQQAPEIPQRQLPPPPPPPYTVQMPDMHQVCKICVLLFLLITELNTS